MAVHVVTNPRVSLRLRALTVAIPVVLALAGPARAEDPVTESDRRATLALWNSVAPEDVRRTLDQVSPEGVRRLDRYVPNAADGGREYVIRFGTAEPDGHGTGFHMISVGAAEADPATRGWTRILRNGDEEGEVWTRDVNTSDRERYREVRVRARFGVVALVVSEKRRKGEAFEESTAGLDARLRRLMAAASDAGLLVRVRVTMAEEGPGAADMPAPGRPPVMTVGIDGVKFHLNVRMLASSGDPLEALWYTVRFTGPLAAFATVEGGVRSGDGSRFELRTPRDPHDVTIAVASPDAAFVEKIFELSQVRAAEPTLICEVAARQKGVRGKDRESVDSAPDARTRFGLRLAPWLAYAPAFFVVPSVDRDRASYDVQPAQPGLFEGLRTLLRDTRVRAASTEYAADEPLYSGFAVDAVTKGPGSTIRAHFGVGLERPLVVQKGEDVRIFTSVDVTAPLDENALHAALRERFEVTGETLTVHRVAADETGVRAANPSDVRPVELYAGPPRPLGVLARSSLPPRAVWHAAEDGVYEFRWKAVVTGSLGKRDARETQFVESAVRVLVGDRPNRFTWRSTDFYAK